MNTEDAFGFSPWARDNAALLPTDCAFDIAQILDAEDRPE